MLAASVSRSRRSPRKHDTSSWEIAWSIERGREYLGPEAGPAVARRARDVYRRWAFRGAGRLVRRGRPLAAMGQLWGIRHLWGSGAGAL